MKTKTKRKTPPSSPGCLSCEKKISRQQEHSLTTLVALSTMTSKCKCNLSPLSAPQSRLPAKCLTRPAMALFPRPPLPTVLLLRPRDLPPETAPPRWAPPSPHPVDCSRSPAQSRLPEGTPPKEAGPEEEEAADPGNQATDTMMRSKGSCLSAG